jgi:hypothetical protein
VTDFSLGGVRVSSAAHLQKCPPPAPPPLLDPFLSVPPLVRHNSVSIGEPHFEVSTRKNIPHGHDPPAPPEASESVPGVSF